MISRPSAFFKKTLLAISSAIALTGSLASANNAPEKIIFIVGDGMGAPYVSAYRYYMHGKKPLPVAPTLFDEITRGTVQTYPHDDTFVTDSAAAATALSAGVKTYNGAIGVDVDKKPVETLLERAKKHGYQTGLVVTSSVTHATPASFAAHVASRSDAQRIADQYFDQKINDQFRIDLILGGGKKFFEREDRNLVSEFKSAGFQYAESLQQLNQITGLPALGLLADDGMPHALGSSHPTRLANMVEKSLDLLGKKPFFLLVEASQIDWCGHANDIACAIAEMHDLHETLKVVDSYIKDNPDTLLIMTADHNTGGLTVGANNEYAWRSELIRDIKLTASPLAQALLDGKKDWRKVWDEQVGITLNDTDAKAIDSLLRSAPPKDAKSARDQLARLSLDIINKATATGWTSFGHTGEDVLLFAKGKSSELFHGNMNNTQIPETLMKLMK